MAKKKRLWPKLLALGCLCSIPCGVLGLFIATSSVNDQGSPELAAEWKAELSQYRTPEEAKAMNPKVVILQFKNGEWAFGLAQSSHGLFIRGGGTIVVKDSKGKIRAFFGHVCGSNGLGEYSIQESLDSFYSQTLSSSYNYVEYTFP